MGKPAVKKTSKSKKSTKRKKKKSGLGFSFWFALLFFIVLVFAVGHKPIRNAVAETDFYKKFFTENSASEAVVEKVEKKKGKAEEKSAPVVNAEKETVIDLRNEAESADTRVVEKTDRTDSQTAKSVRDSALYYVRITDEGNIALTKTVRKVYYSGSPLNASINALLEGLSSSELNKGLISLIPEKTRLLGISVESGVASINFSEEFMFNTFGKEGTIAQLMQIVYTAVEFPTVREVQFLVNNHKVNYLSEGVYTGEPIGVDYFN